MIVAGCDIGSSTAKAVVLKNKLLVSSAIGRITASPVESAKSILIKALNNSGLCLEDVECCCSTGYGRFEIPFADFNMSEISCHGFGAFMTDNTVRTIIDIGGQDCKVISVDTNGQVTDFIMNDKCAAGTGHSLEIVSRLLDVPVEKLGTLASRSRSPLKITNKCGIFMELDVINALLKGRKHKDIACGLAESVAARIASLASSVNLKSEICVTGGVAKNTSVIRQLEKRINCRIKTLHIDPQLTGAFGAAMFASGTNSSNIKEIITA